MKRIRLDRVFITWSTKEQMILKNLSLTLASGELCMVVGRVGSGKSSLLLTLLGELPIACGQCHCNGRMSYAAQEPWLFAGTVRDNIIFGGQFEPDRYKEVVRVCCLEQDFASLIVGDQTEVGERGVSLSGGQKARVNLARALYQEADIYLLDDPFSAVDTQVARHIFDESVRNFLKGKTVLLATHQLQFLGYADKVLLLSSASVSVFGTLDDVAKSEAFSSIRYGKEAFEEAIRHSVVNNQVELGNITGHPSENG